MYPQQPQRSLPLRIEGADSIPLSKSLDHDMEILRNSPGTMVIDSQLRNLLISKPKSVIHTAQSLMLDSPLTTAPCPSMAMTVATKAHQTISTPYRTEIDRIAPSSTAGCGNHDHSPSPFAEVSPCFIQHKTALVTSTLERDDWNCMLDRSVARDSNSVPLLGFNNKAECGEPTRRPMQPPVRSSQQRFLMSNQVGSLLPESICNVEQEKWTADFSRSFQLHKSLTETTDVIGPDALNPWTISLSCPQFVNDTLRNEGRNKPPVSFEEESKKLNHTQHEGTNSVLSTLSDDEISFLSGIMSLEPFTTPEEMEEGVIEITSDFCFHQALNDNVEEDD